MSMRRCPAVVFAGCGKAEIRQVAIPPITDEEILVRSLCTGISVGTERWYLTGKVKGVAERYPLIPGYQRIGIVEEAGRSVQAFKPGDRVWLGAWAMRLDPSDGLSGGGSHSQYAVAHHSRALPVPGKVSTEEAALATLAAVGMVGLELTPAKLDDLVVVIGQGIVGLMSAQLARLTGAYVVTSDLIERRVALSGKYCADRAVNASKEKLEDVVRGLSPDGADLVIDTSGNSKRFGDDVDLLKRPGKLCLQGYFPEPIQVDFHDTHWKRTTVAFPMGFEMDGVTRAFHLLERKRITISPLITHRIESEDALEAYRLLLDQPDDIVGMILVWE
jgi:2-desacetyl-2-hydroxyethyl bacteriochlorophyllide A dehydrogenase